MKRVSHVLPTQGSWSNNGNNTSGDEPDVFFQKGHKCKMHGTLKMLKTICDPSFSEMADCDICKKYQTDLYKDPRLLATMWVRHYNLILLKHSNPMFEKNISLADLASFSMECMDKSLLYFKPNSKNKFNTYFATMLYNRLREEYQNLRCDKRVVQLFSISLDIDPNAEPTDSSEFILPANTLEDTSNHDLDNVDFKEFLSQIGLTPNQYYYCTCKLESYENIDVARFLGVTPAAVNNIRKGVLKKLSKYLPEISTT